MSLSMELLMLTAVRRGGPRAYAVLGHKLVDAAARPPLAASPIAVESPSGLRAL